MKRLILFCIILLSGALFSACNPLSKKAKSGLQVITDNVQASVYLNDNYVEKTPFINRELNPGEYTLKIQPDDPKLIPYETTITLRSGLLSVVTWKLAERPELGGGVIYEMEPINSKNKSEISFVTIPDGAIISVAGKEKVFSPVIVEDVLAGHNEFEVSLPSYESQKHTINVIPGYRMLVTVKLAKVNLNAQTETVSDTIEQAEPSTSSATATTSATPIIDTPVIVTETETTTVATTSALTTTSQIKIKATNFFNEGIEVLRVRDFPGGTGKELGFAEVGKNYPYTGTTQNNWYNITFNEKSGWVSGQYAELVP